MALERPLLVGLVFALALRISSILHEGAHALAGWLYGASFTVSSWAVHANDVPASVGIIMALAGPLYSLLQGIACLLASRLLEPKNGAPRLLVIWLALHGFSAGFGYMLTPYAGKGDVFVACQLLGLGNAARLPCVLLGAAGLLWTGWLCATLLLPFAESDGAVAVPDARARLLQQIALVPWLLGTVIALAFAWPYDNLFGLIYEVISGTFTIAAYRFARRIAAPTSAHGWPATPIWPWALVTASVMLASQLTIGQPP